MLPLLVLCGLFMGRLHAEPIAPCPASFPAQVTTSASERATEIERLARLGDVCSHRADYFAYQGVVFLIQRHPQQAAIALEKALMLDPDLPGAQLDYAQALAELGELDTARQLALDVSRRPDLPLTLQVWLSDRLKELGQTSWSMEWSAQWLTGRESNLNSGPAIQTLTLTLPGGDVPVQLAATERRRAGSAQRMDLAGAVSRPIGGGLLFINGEISSRNRPGNDETNQRILGFNAAYLHPTPVGELGLRLNGARLTMGGQETYAARGWGFLYLLPENLSPGACRLGLSHDQEQREFPASPALAGAYAGHQAWINCRQGDWQFNLGLQAGLDQAKEPERLGGDQRRKDLLLGVSHPIGLGVLAFSAQRGKLQDQQMYSALLGGQPRAVTRTGLRISLEYPLMKRFFLVSYYERASQNSNIDLFNIENNALYLGVKYRGP